MLLAAPAAYPYTSPLWPAAGLALAALLMCGLRCWPGIWLGAFLIDVGLDPSPAGAAIAALLATGITLQAVLGARLTRRFLIGPWPLGRERDIWGFLLLGGPVACLVGATAGTLVLSACGRMSAASPSAQWLLWWTGDVLGVLLFAPLVLLAWPGPGALWPQEKTRVALPLLVTAALLAAGHLALDRLEESRARAEAHALMEDVYENGIHALLMAVEPLRALERFFAASEEVSREEYAIFTSGLVGQTGILSIDWAPRIAAEERKAFEAAQRVEGRAGYRIFELDADRQPRAPGERAEYFPVRFTAPERGNEAVPGLDHGFEAPRRAAMAHAAGSARIATAAAVPLLRTRRHVLLSFQPVYHAGFDAPAATAVARRDALQGFIVGVFDVAAIFQPMQRGAENHRIEFRITDVTPGSAPHHLAGTLAVETAVQWHREVNFTDRRWRVEMYPVGGYWQSGASMQARLYFGFSLLAAFLVAFAALSAAGRQAAAEALVAVRTAELRTRENDLEITLHSIGDGVLATDAQGRITRMNPVAAALTGWPVVEAVGRPVAEVFRIINEESRQPAAVPVDEVLRTGEIHGLANHTVLLARDGRECPIADSAAPIRDDAGRMHGVVLVFHDVSRERAADQALRESEARYREFIEGAPLGVFVQCDGRFVFMNPRAAALLGASTPDELLGRPVLDFIHPDSREVVSSRIHQLREHQEAVPALEEKWLRLDGTMFHGEATAVPYLHEGQHAALVMLQDVTVRKEAEAQIVQARTEAEQANRAKSAFLATMSHEIRTPMNGVLGMVEILAQGRLSAHQRELVGTIHQSATTLLSLIDDILDFSKIEAGRLEIEQVPVSVPDIVEGLCNSLVPVAAAKGVDLSLFIAPDIPQRLLSDDVRLRQVFYNLIGNAIKFSVGEEAQRGRVAVRVEALPGTPYRLTFRITDNGIGMKPETLAQLFTPFTQAEVATTRRFGGTGLGLAICKRLVELMGGEIGAESTFGTGSVFTVTLPFAIAEEQPPLAPPALAGIDCILVHSPELHTADLRTYLEHAGARVAEAANPAAAAALAAGRDGDTVVIGYAGRERPQVDTAFTAVPQVRHLLITQGRRRRARVEAPDVVTLDGDALRRHALVRAVAVAAGRASPEIFQDHNEDDLGREETAPPPTVAEARAQGRLILIAEDDDLNQRVILQQLRLLGYAGEVAANGGDALRLWRKGHYALLLTDLHMPEMDGYTLAQTIRQEERGARMPIIALTANALRGEASRAQAAGMDAYLTKPVPLRQLRTTLEQWLPRVGSVAGAAAPDSGDAAQQAVALVDIAVLKQLVGDDEETLREFLADYLASARRLAGEMEAACAAGDVRHVSAVAHKLKSSSRAVGALALGDLCAGLENAGKEGDKEAVAGQMREVTQTLRTVEEEIRALLTPQEK